LSSVLLLIVGLAGLLLEAELLVRGGSNLASRLGVTPILLGPTFDLPAIAAASVLVFIMARDGFLDRIEGVVLFFASVGYTLVVFRTSRKESAQLRAEFSTEYAVLSPPIRRPCRSRLDLPPRRDRGHRGGADLLVGGAATATRSLRLSDAIVGLTVVAIGMSAPDFVTTCSPRCVETATLLLATCWSSVYNLALTFGLTILFDPTVVEVPAEVLEGDLVLMAAAAIACVPVLLSGRRINRVDGGLFVAAYCVLLAPCRTRLMTYIGGWRHVLTKARTRTAARRA
jgi:cation:H+ antiporter